MSERPSNTRASLKESSQKSEAVIIREAAPEDVSQIISNSQTTDRFRVSAYTDEMDEEELRFWITDERSIVIVAVLDTRLVGYAYGLCLSPKWFFFDEFVLIPQVRGRGIGKKMYTYLREVCRKRGLQLIQAIVKDDESKALEYWIGRGFEQGSKCIWVEDWLYKD